MSNNERDQKGGHSNSDNSDEKDWVAVKALYDDLKTTKKPRPVSDVFFPGYCTHGFRARITQRPQ